MAVDIIVMLDFKPEKRKIDLIASETRSKSRNDPKQLISSERKAKDKMTQLIASERRSKRQNDPEQKVKKRQKEIIT